MAGATAEDQRQIHRTIRRHTALYLWWLMKSRPSVAFHFIADSLRYRHGVPADAEQNVAEARAEFEKQAALGQFKELWFDMNIAPWCVTLSKVFRRSDPLRILEIGSWEGRSSLFLLTYFPQAHLTAVDTWAGTDQYEYNATEQLSDLERRFDQNLNSCAARLTKRKGSSLSVVPQLIEEGQQFDLIYVDGSHFADDAFTDAINSWRLLKQGGVMIFDDVMWPCFPRTRANTAWAINMFLTYHAREYKVLHAHYQFILQKTKAFTDKPADWRTTFAPPVSDDAVAATGG